MSEWLSICANGDLDELKTITQQHITENLLHDGLLCAYYVRVLIIMKKLRNLF
jgi:hypothetical protein